MAEALPGGDGFALDAILIGDDGKGITGSDLVMQPRIQNPILGSFWIGRNQHRKSVTAGLWVLP